MSRRSTAKRLLIALVLIAASIAATYAATPAIVARLGPLVADRFGLTTLDIDIDHPRWRGVTVRRLSLGNEGLLLVGRNARAEYSLPELFQGRLESLVFAELELSLSQATGESKPGEPVAFDPGYFAPPVGYLSAERLRIEFSRTGFVGVGRASLGDGVLSLLVEGVAPEAASRLALSAELSADGVFVARFTERGDDALEYLRLDGTIGGAAVDLTGRLTLEGFALELASDILGLPAGNGSASAAFETALPWPLPDAGDWPVIEARIPAFAVDWRSAQGDLLLENLRGTAMLSGSGAGGAVSGKIVYRVPPRQASVEFPAGYRYTFEDGTLSGPAGLRLRLKEADGEAYATLRSFTLRTAPDVKLDYDGDLLVRTNAAGLEGRTRGRLSVTSFDPPAVAGNVDFGGEVAFGGERRPGSVAASFSLNAGVLEATGKLSSNPFTDVPFELRQNVDTGAGAFHARKRLVFRKALAASILPGWREDYDLDAGQVDAVVQLDWQTTESIAADVTLVLDEVRAHYGKNAAQGIRGTLDLRSADAADPDAWRLEPSALSAGRIDIGLPISELRMNLAGSAESLTVSGLRAALLGGQVFAEPFDYGIETGSADVLLRLEDLDLALVLALEGDDIVGSGRLDGDLPVKIRDSKPGVEGGTIRARPPGGTIRLTPSFSGPSGQAGLDFALLALKDFRYSELSAAVDYAANGDLDLAVRLMGRNPEVEKGRAILYNLNISENVPALLESLRLQDRLSEKIEERMR